MVECVNCRQYRLSDGEWYCNYCGTLREDCAEPGCFGEIEDRTCNQCGAVPDAVCRHCDEWIPADAVECPKCGKSMKDTGSLGWLGSLGLPLILLGVLAIVVGNLLFPIWFNIFTFIPLGLLSILAGVVLSGVLTIGGLLGDKAIDKEHQASVTSAELKKESDAWSKKANKETLDAIASATETAAEAASDYTEQKKQEKRAREREKQKQREREKAQKRKNMEEDVTEVLNKARSKDLSSPNIDVLWEMNCDRCGITWATTQNKKLMRSDDFRTHNFNIVNEEDWNYIQDRVEIQCDAPDCNNVNKFTKDSLWST